MKNPTFLRALSRLLFYCGLLGCLSACQSADDSALIPDPDKGSPGNEPDYATLIAPLVKCMNLPRPADAYDYPLYPGMAAWSTLSSGQEMQEACQIPMKVVQAQSTRALIQDLWEYPFFNEPMLVTSHTGLAQAVATSGSLRKLNAYRELVGRKDNIACLLTCYQAMDPISDPLCHTYAFEALLTADDWLPSMTTADKKTFIRIALQKDRLRQTDSKRSDAFRSVSWYFIGKLLHAASYPPFLAEIAANETLARFLDTSSKVEATSSVLEIIENHAKTFIE